MNAANTVRTLVISDIHGCLKQFQALLAQARYRPSEDRLLLLGDYIDRGPCSKEVVESVMKLSRENRVTVLRGNHDQRFVDLFDKGAGALEQPFFEHGGMQTLLSYWNAVRPGQPFERKQFREALKLIQDHYADHLAFLRTCGLYAEDEQHIYVHAGLNPSYRNWKKQPERDFYTIRQTFLGQRTVVDKTVVFGHTQTLKLHGKADVWFGADKIGIDGGCCSGYQLNALEIVPGQPYRMYAVQASS